MWNWPDHRSNIGLEYNTSISQFMYNLCRTFLLWYIESRSSMEFCWPNVAHMVHPNSNDYVYSHNFSLINFHFFVSSWFSFHAFIFKKEKIKFKFSIEKVIFILSIFITWRVYKESSNNQKIIAFNPTRPLW